MLPPLSSPCSLCGHCCSEVTTSNFITEQKENLCDVCFSARVLYCSKTKNTKIVHRVETFTFHCSFSFVLNMAASRSGAVVGEGEMLGLEIICTVPPLSSHHSPPPQLQGMVTRSNWQDNLVFDVKITLLSLHILCTQNWFMFLDRFRNHLKTYVK